MAPCTSCAKPHGPNFARGLCGACRSKALRDGTIEDYPRKHWRRDELVAEYDFLRRHEGLTRAQAAERLGIKRDRLDKALERTAKIAA